VLGRAIAFLKSCGRWGAARAATAFPLNTLHGSAGYRDSVSDFAAGRPTTSGICLAYSEIYSTLSVPWQPSGDVNSGDFVMAAAGTETRSPIMQTPHTDLQAQAAPKSNVNIVREYTSTSAFDLDARDLYAHTRYTVSNTAGGPCRGLKGIFFSFWPHEEHLTITYQSPTNPHPTNAQ